MTPAESVALRALVAQFTPGGAEAVLRDYLKLHEGKIGAHWLWCAVQRIVAGRETEADVLADFGYVALAQPDPAVVAESAEQRAVPDAWQERQQRADGWSEWYDTSGMVNSDLREACEITVCGIRYQLRPLYAAPTTKDKP